jgi:hypothetical protein
LFRRFLPFRVKILTGAAEVPGPGDPDGRGHAHVRVFPKQDKVCFEIDVSNIELPATAAHIHRGSADVAGPVVVDLAPPGADGHSEGCVSVQDRELLRSIKNNPSGFYVNVHNTPFPAGAVRGQLSGGDED